MNKMTVAESRQQRTDRASQAIGRLLLQAWAMLDETCPNPGCGCVIMQSPNRGRKTCVLCGDLPLAVAPLSAQAPAPTPMPVPVPAVVDSAMNVDDQDEDEDKVQQDDDDEMNVQRQLVLETERQRARLLAASAGSAGAPVLASPASTVASTTVFEPSRLLGQRMLQGWTLLGDVCPRCTSVPLVSKDNVRECVACGPLPSRTATAAAPSVRRQPSPAPAPVDAPTTTSQRAVSPAPIAVVQAHLSTSTIDIHAIVQRKINHVAGRLEAADRVADIQHCAQVLRELLALQKDLA
ncbi:hypothetical protein BCR44DRAFT_69161 [Catenaria anguillulae PL171]|uniref:Uncharacterized protein n=1 Tax=Catenaria anguillulae PL171 TaxID=765915 RepID=A0A1Y2H4G0_9FUNG|nr:hypothetical protein BCR44DRAFT_69161 [Catenaria anguillulae PL171]